MLSFFMAGPDMVRWDLTVESDGPFRLTVRHAQGVIIEYFNTSAGGVAAPAGARRSADRRPRRGPPPTDVRR